MPFAQKDEAKALGTRWDAVEKKWFVPADKDIALFVRWQAEAGAVASPKSKAAPAKIGSSSKKTNLDQYLVSVDEIERVTGENIPVADYAKHDKPSASWLIPHGCNKG